MRSQGPQALAHGRVRGGHPGGLVNRHRERERGAPKLGQSQRATVTAGRSKSARDTAAQGRGLRRSHPRLRDPGLPEAQAQGCPLRSGSRDMHVLSQENRRHSSLKRAL